MTNDDDARRLYVICSMIDDFCRKNIVLTSTQSFLEDVKAVTSQYANEQERIVISTGFTVDPGKWTGSKVAWVIEHPNQVQAKATVKYIPSRTEIEAAIDVVYEALVSYFGMVNNPGLPVEIRSSCLDAVRLLNFEIGSQNKKVLAKKDNLFALVKELPVEISVEWYPYCSSNAMKLACNSASET